LKAVKLPPAAGRATAMLLLLTIAVLATAALATTYQLQHQQHQQHECVIPAGAPIQPRLDAAAAAGSGSGAAVLCRLAEGVHRLTAPVVLPPGMSLSGAGVSRTTVLSAIPSTPPFPPHRQPRHTATPPTQIEAAAPAGWPLGPRLAPGLPPQPLLSAFVARNGGAYTLSNMTVDAGLSEAQRTFSNAECGEGVGSDASLPGFAACRFWSLGIYVDTVVGCNLRNLRVTNASRGLFVRGSRDVAVAGCTFAHNGFGTQWGDSIVDSHSVQVTNCTFVGSLGHGLSTVRSHSSCLRP
jgi:hypothetical protein